MELKILKFLLVLILLPLTNCTYVHNSDLNQRFGGKNFGGVSINKELVLVSRQGNKLRLVREATGTSITLDKDIKTISLHKPVAFSVGKLKADRIDFKGSKDSAYINFKFRF